jgi:hypothetical protein
MAQPDSTPLTTEKAANNQEAGHLRELANAASRRAADWDALAKAARDAAAKATDPVIKKSWEDGARAHETRAKEQREEAARLTAQADEKAPPVKQSGAAPPSAPPPPPAGPPPIATGTAVAPAPGTPLGQPAASRCGPNSADAPLPIEGIAGKWRSDDGKEVVEIAPKTPGDNSKFVLRGQFEWEGSYDGSKLIFIRKPKANEMGDLAPGWALTKVAGVLQWSLELEARRKCGVARIEGQWFPGTVKFLEEKDAVGGIVRQEVSITGKGKPVAVKYTRDAPAIAGAFALEVQTGFTAAGNPKKPYPFQASVSPLFAEPLRTLFVYGFDLPKDKIRITSEDPAIEYSVIATSKHLFGSPANLADPQKALFVKGWNQVMSALDADTATLARDMDSVLVQARLRSGTVLPGIKHFAMNELDGSWRLRFGDDRATITLVREITPKMYDSTTSLILPERFAIEVRTDGDFPIDVIPLKLQLNVRPITWNGKPTLAARKMPRDPAVDLLRKDMKETPLPLLSEGGGRRQSLRHARGPDAFRRAAARHNGADPAQSRCARNDLEGRADAGRAR